jgi:hypothetical protein
VRLDCGGTAKAPVHIRMVEEVLQTFIWSSLFGELEGRTIERIQDQASFERIRIEKVQKRHNKPIDKRMQGQDNMQLISLFEA